MSRDSGFFGGIIFGGVIGFVAGVLLAPASGEETRTRLKKFKDENDDLIQETKMKTEHVVSKTMDAIDAGFDKLTKVIEERNQAKS